VIRTNNLGQDEFLPTNVGDHELIRRRGLDGSTPTAFLLAINRQQWRWPPWEDLRTLCFPCTRSTSIF